MTIAILLAAVASPPPPLPGIYTNEEEVYFDGEAKRTPAPWIGLKSDDRGHFSFVDKFGRPAPAVAITRIHAVDDSRVQLTLRNGRITELRRARTATCWGASLKAAKKPDGSDDWYGVRGLKLHDQGGRVSFGGGDSGAPEATLRMRNVVWPAGPNRPSLVLYIHTPQGGERAVSYSWGDKDAKTIGINLRWMQASCTIDDATGGIEK